MSPTKTAGKAAVSHTLAIFGRIDVLVNNAGIANGAPIADFPLALWQKTLDINLTGAFLGIRAVTPLLVAQKSGSIINISSVEGLRGSAGAARLRRDEVRPARGSPNRLQWR